MFADNWRRRAAAFLALAVMTPAISAAGDPSKPSAVDVLFEAKHFEGLDKGEKLFYYFKRNVSKPGVAGDSYTDNVTIKIDGVADEKRNITINIFTGDRAREPQVLPGLTGNPLLILFLDRCVKNYNALGGGDHPYLKGVFRSALRDKAKINPVKIDYQGKSVDGYKIEVTPYVGDPNAAKMNGYEISKFTFIVSSAVPGHFVRFASLIESKQERLPKVEEEFTAATPEGVALAKIGETK